MSVFLVLEIVVYILVVLFLSISIYGNVILYRCKSEMFIQKRNIFILFGLNCAFLIGIILDGLVQLGQYHLPKLTQTIFITISFANISIFFFFGNVKNFHLFFKSKWTYYAMQLKWKYIIDNSLPDEDSNWFLRNNYKYSNISYIFKLFLLYHSVGIITDTIAVFSEHISFVSSTMRFILTIPGLLAIVFYLIIVCKTRSVEDKFYINWENKWHAKILCTMVAAHLLFVVIVSQFKNLHLNIRATVPILIDLFTHFSLNCVSTFGICSKNHEPLRLISESSHAITLEMILTNKNCIQLFMEHLADEYSMELLLCYIEVTQYQQYTLQKSGLKNNSDNDEDIQAVINGLVSFPSNIPFSCIVKQKTAKPKPHSDIVHQIELQRVVSLSTSATSQNSTSDIGNFNLSDAKKQAYQLYKKYIERNSEYEVNLSSLHRNELDILTDINMLENVNVTERDLVLLLDNTKRDMYKLLFYSFCRLKSKEEFEPIKHYFQNN
eukprot:142088_1